MESGKGFGKHESSESHQFSYNVWNRKMIESGTLESIADKLYPIACCKYCCPRKNIV
jgi:hypothetical protein